MTELMINAGRLAEPSRVADLVALGVTADVANAREVTLADIHSYITMQERRMNSDVENVLNEFAAGIRRNGFTGVRIRDLIRDIEVSNAMWHRHQPRVDEGNFEGFEVRAYEANTYAQTAQITPIDMLTWLGCTPDPIQYLIEHTRRLRIHNEEMEAIGQAAARFADEKQYCSEYDDIVNRIIGNFTVTNCPVFAQRPRKFEMMVAVTIHVPVTVDAPNSDVAADIVSDQIQTEALLDSYNNGNYEVTGIEMM
jgi:hypothetical protein